MAELKDMIEIRILGPIGISVDGKPVPKISSKKALWLLALLALRPGASIHRADLALALWPDQDVETARGYLRHALVALRKALGSGADTIESPDANHLRLRMAGLSVDLDAFDELLSKSPLSAIASYQSRLLEGCDEPWALRARQTREANMLEILEEHAARCSPHEAVKYLQQAIAIDPFRENSQRGLIRAQFECGDQAASVKTYRAFKQLLHRELNISPSPETEALLDSLRNPRISRSAPAPIPALAGPRRSFPQPLTALIGREQDIAIVTELMRTKRLVTITGFGGCGKTRLAIEVGLGEHSRFRDGICFVDLSPISEESLVAQAIGLALSHTEAAESNWRTILLKDLAHKNMLIILDNCEHLVEECASIASALIANCPHLTVLATSRQPLRIEGERTYAIPRLETPPEDASDVPTCLGFSAARLLAERACEANPLFAVSESNVKCVAGICRRLEGIPLAIELAAARVRTMHIEQIHARLTDRFRLLTEGVRSAPQRHWTLKGLFDWSYDLLSEKEKALLARLSVFVGGWTLESAEHVCSWTPIVEDEVHALLSSLVEKSLVVHDDKCNYSRYRLLAPIRVYASEHLAESNETDQARARHFHHYLALASEGRAWRVGAGTPEWFTKCDLDYDNMRAATDWAFANDTPLALQIVAALGPLWVSHGHCLEGQSVTRRALELQVDDPGAVDRLEILMHFGFMTLRQNDRAEAKSIYMELERLARARGHSLYISRALGGLGSCMADPFALENRNGLLAGACSLYQEALSLADERNVDARPQELLSNLGLAHWWMGDFASAMSFLDRALQTSRRNGDREMEAFALLNIGNVLSKTERFEESIPMVEAGERIFRDLDLRTRLKWALATKHFLASSSGDGDLCRIFSKEMILLAEETCDTELEVVARCCLADQHIASREFHLAAEEMTSVYLVLSHSDLPQARLNFYESAMFAATRLQNYARAAKLLGAVGRLATTVKSPRWDADQLRTLTAESTALSLGAERFDRLVLEGSVMSDSVALAFAAVS